MILTAFDVYFIGQLDTFNQVCGWLVFPSIVVNCAWFIFYYATKYDNSFKNEREAGIVKFSHKWLIILSVITFLLSALAIFLPSTKTAAAMIILPPMVNAVTQNKELQQLPPKLLGLANDWIDALKPEGKK